MRVRVLGGFGSEGIGQRPSAFLINERILIDGGTVGGALSVPEQLKIEHALISHSHLDHVAGLAYLTDTLACGGRLRPVTLASIEPVVSALRASVFNNVAWPDFTALPPGAPVLQFRTLIENAEQQVDELFVTPVAVSHSVPATGFIVRDGDSALVYSGDTGPTDAIWQAARAEPRLRAIILECAFPNRLGKIASFSKHMTPELIEQELGKLPPGVPVWIFHIKPQFYDETAAELRAIKHERIVLLEQDATYTI